MKDKLSSTAKILGAAAAVTLIGMKAIAFVTKDHEYDEENKKIRAEADHAYKNIYEKILKRAIDIILSYFGLLALSPAYAVVSLAIAIDDPGPVMFTQKRFGKNKTYFKLHKFRSMKKGAPHDIPTHLLGNPERYLTGIGRYIRKYSLDELPQVWDIFVGNMSIVGPRPALWNQADLIAERDKYGANSIKPGLTGWAQINGRDELEIQEKARLDGVYASSLHKSLVSGLKMDTKCFFGTVSSVILADGVLEGGPAE